MSWLDSKYISLLSGRLQKFKRKSAVLFNFRCPMCGDSEKNKNKARAYFFQRDGAFWFHCHNCGVSLPFFRFLKQFDGGLYHEYQMEKLGDQHHKLVTPQQERLAKPRDGNEALKSLEPISGLPKSQIAYSYCVNRGIPKPFFKELYYCFDFKTWTNLQIPGKLENWPDESRLIIPFFDPQGKMFAFQGRALEDVVNNIRYVTIFLDETKPKIWGWNRVNFNEPYYVTEGPFDAMFLSNSIATAGGKITSELYKIGCNIDNAIVVYDNEPRNPQVVANIRAAVKQNFRVVIWPPSNHPFKDINEWVLGGHDIEKILRDNTYYGLSAEIEFNRWRKI